MALPVANAAVVVAGIPGDVLQRTLRRDMAAGPADDHGKLAFVVEVSRYLRADQWLQVSHLAACKARKQNRLLRHGPAGLGNVVMVVEADADDLVRIGNDGQQRQPGQCVVGTLVHERRCFRQIAGLEQGAQRGRPPPHAAAEAHDAAVADDPVICLAIELE